MRKRINNTRSARPSNASVNDTGAFKKKRAEDSKWQPESRFSKPSIKKSSLRQANSANNKTEGSARPAYNKADREKAPYQKAFENNDRKFSRSFGKEERTTRQDFDKRRFDTTGSERSGGDKPYGRTGADGSFRPKRAFGSDRKPDQDRKPFSDRKFGSKEGIRPRTERPAFEKENKSDRPFKTREDRRPSERPTSDGAGHVREDRKVFDRPASDRGGFDKGTRTFKRNDGGRESDRPTTDRGGYGRGERSFKPREDRENSEERGSRRFQGENGNSEKEDSGADRRVGKFSYAPRYDLSGYEKKAPVKKGLEQDDIIRLNRYISNAGICSRREADDLISSGQISVNGKAVTEMGYKVKVSDVVKYGKRSLNPEKMVYVLINKPKDYITTTDDPEDRKTVLDLIKGACSERIYPVGRLDRNTTGLLLMTNDGELAEKLTHPSSGIKKVYQAELDKPITTEDFELLQHGIELEDGFIRPDEIGIVTPDAFVVGLEIHSGRNRIVRRMFEHLGYEVKKLDRTVFAGLNKKDLPRGKWRFLSEKELIKLKYML